MNKSAVGWVLLLLQVPLMAAQQGNPQPSVTRPSYTLEDSIRGVESYQPRNGFIPDQTTAVKVAEVILIPIYGEKVIIAERPFKATLENEIWTIVGTLQPGLTGGTAIIKLSKSDARVLFVIHQQ